MICEGRSDLCISVIFLTPDKSLRAEVFLACSGLLRHHSVTALLFDAKALIPNRLKVVKCSFHYLPTPLFTNQANYSQIKFHKGKARAVKQKNK